MTEIRDYYESIDVHIHLADGSNLIVTISPNDSVETLKQKIRQSLPKRTQNMNIRLIYQGRILTENDQPLSHSGIGLRGGKDQQQPSVYIHCSISDYIPRNSKSITTYQENISNNNDRVSGQEDNNNTDNQMTRLLGFDRLQEAGFNEEEIRDIRVQFHRLHGSPNFDGEITEQTTAMEEQWMESTGEILPDGCKSIECIKKKRHLKLYEPIKFISGTRNLQRNDVWPFTWILSWNIMCFLVP
ncbi:hypothetical protein BDC45DRAFT_517085 [Circinella umbellata]|nr:hypothetical protein BDC45DRAFT_517085 [Circinella umbellata]